ncbi:SR-related and CTD-associated factor 4 isoform X2 [Culicoides brevitarsis]|uniref:SR-related and CTD-associated factor 4 isoform X2 n=1 Tax=Culicoides brevitarsis TaxID=469753 RepID=UPI00307C79AB
METVRLFNAELQSLYEITPPISKQKMGSITRTAMKSIKFYKHVVQSVEKFIQKCKTEYKIPGLYVIDSIVRQSRHQFGPEKDVFAPRFARNMETTFAHLFKCPPEDKSKIIRVLNLWQKNSVFPPETVQPLFDLANPDHPLHQSQALEAANNSMDQSLQLGPGDELLAGQDKSKPLDQNTIRQLQQFQQMLMRQTSGENSSVKFNKNLLDFDYGEDEEDHGAHSSSPHASNAIPDSQTTYGMGSSAYNTLQYVQMQAEAGNMPDTDPEVQFVSSNDKDEVINLDANESRSSSPRHDRYRRRRSRSRSRDRSKRDRRRRTLSRSRSRSPRRSRRSREREREHEKERKRKGLPDIKKDHLSVCSTTLWVGHLSKLVQQEELSDTFGKYGDIVSIDMIPPRGCAFIVMHRRQDAYKSMQALKGYKMHNRVITISWAAGKGVKSKEWKDYWDIDLGVSYIPWNKLTKTTNFSELEEGGMFDEETMPSWLKDKLKEQPAKEEGEMAMPPNPLMFGVPPAIDTSQPPPAPALMIPNFPMTPVPRLITPMGIPVPMLNIPPPHMMMSNPASALMPLNPFSAPPPSFNAQLFGNSVPVPITNATDDHMDIEGEEEMSNNSNKPPVKSHDGGYNAGANQKSYNQLQMGGGQRNDDRTRDQQGRRDNSDRHDHRHGNRFNSAEREDSYERDSRRPRGLRNSGGPMRHDRERPLQDRLRDMAGNNGTPGGRYGPRGDNRGNYRNENYQGAMQRNDFNRGDDGYDRRNFGGNRFNNNMPPMRGGRGGNQFGSRMQSNYGPRPGFQRYSMYDEERNNRGPDRRKQWNDDMEERPDRNSPKYEKKQDEEETWDNEAEPRWNENESQTNEDCSASANSSNKNDTNAMNEPQDVPQSEELPQDQQESVVHSDNNVANQMQEENVVMEENVPQDTNASENMDNNQKENTETQEGGTTPLFDE